MMIERNPVKSSNVKSVGYDKDNKTLAVEFSDGSLYHYHNVSQDMHDDLMDAESMGKFLHFKIKGVYKHEKQDKEE